MRVRIMSNRLAMTAALLAAVLAMAPACSGPVSEAPLRHAPPVAALTVEALQNAEYQGIYAEPVQLTDGQYEGEPFVEGGASRPTVTFIEPYAFGDLNGDSVDDAVVLLVENSGGSGSFVYMAAVLNINGLPNNVATQLLGDRARVEAITIAEGVTTVEMVGFGPNDPMCCPSLQIVETYELQGDTLVQLSHEEKGPVTLTLEALQNAQYQGIYAEPVQLTDGKYEGEPFVEGGASRPTVTFIEPYALGDLNADGLEDAVVLLVENSGGSGSFVYLAAVLNQSGNPFNVATQFLSDRARVEAITVAEGIISIDMLAHGPNDPMCCPSQQIVETYELQAAALVQLSHEEKQATDLTGLVDVTWRWVSLTDAAGRAQITVANPERYLLELGKDGLYQVTADCNRASGAYTVDGQAMSLLPGPTTLAECEPGSLYDEFLSYLGAVESYTLEDGQLLLRLAAGGPIMHFAKQVSK